MSIVNYQTKDYNAIFEDYLRKASANGLLSNNEDDIKNILHSESIENILIMELAIHSEILTETYKDLTTIKNLFDLNQASGQDLDQLLQPFVLRREPAYAHTEIQFQKDETHINEINISAGTQITATPYPEITFQTLTDTTIPRDEKEARIYAVCTRPGPEGNVPSRTLNQLTNPINGITEVTNPESATGGRNREDDGSYRLRGHEWTNINTQGTIKAFENAISDVASVEDYYIERRWDGPGTTRIIINPPITTVIETVNEAISYVCAVDEEYTVIGAENKIININLNIKITKDNPIGKLEKEEAIKEIKNALKEYIEGGYNPGEGKVNGLSLGEDFIPSRAAAHLINTLPDVKDVNITYPTSIIPIDYYQRAVMGEIQIEIP